MRPRIILPTLLLIAAVVASTASTPGAAHAQVPNPAQSTTDGDLMLGNARGLPVIALPNVRPTVTDGYRVVVRDLNANPIPNATVEMDFTNTPIRVHAAQSNGQGAVCPGRITMLTNVAGVAIFYPGTTGIYTSMTPDVVIRANNVLLTSIRFRSIDLIPSIPSNGAAIVDGQDLNAFRLRYLNLSGESEFDPETDFATEGTSAGRTDGFDLNLFRSEFQCGVVGAPIPAPCTQPQCP